MPIVSTVKCPTCEHAVVWSQQSLWRPFCSERCKLIDLGAWATDQYKIAGREQESHLHESHLHESAQTDEGVR